ncbi:MAG: sigma-70 family RNA polymerase sigma factor [Alphaproteobacteria bacterium]|nr:sigma-70 family RNA polymerase sigma factor [Alphaproteobacteria bacterium]MBO7536794.1 sigma-70 family RNA polymerase sigma factor [Alphaproteobacteria bacterium]
MYLEEKIKQIDKTADLSQNAREVLKLFDGNEELTSKEISEKTDLKIETVRKILQKLLKRGDIKKYGTTRSRSYQKM